MDNYERKPKYTVCKDYIETEKEKSRVYIPFDVIVTKVSQDECLNHFRKKSRWKPEVSVTK